jgi:hypothetical protein
MELWCLEADRGEEGKRFSRLFPFDSPQFRISESWHRNKPIPDLQVRLPMPYITKDCPMREWQIAQRRLLKCVFEFGQQLQFEKLDYTIYSGGRLWIKYPDPNSDIAPCHTTIFIFSAIGFRISIVLSRMKSWPGPLMVCGGSKRPERH